jgi:hypothetical protein
MSNKLATLNHSSRKNATAPCASSISILIYFADFMLSYCANSVTAAAKWISAMEWSHVAPLIRPAKHGGRKRKVDVRDVVKRPIGSAYP